MKDRHKLTPLKKAAELFKTKCTNLTINDCLFRQDSAKGINVSKSMMRESESIGNSGIISAYLFSLPAWQHLPKRSESVFCSTSDKIPFSQNNNLALIYPFDSANLAYIESNDYNYSTSNILGSPVTLKSLQTAIECFSENFKVFDSRNSKTSRMVEFKQAIEIIKTFKHDKSNLDEFFKKWNRRKGSPLSSFSRSMFDSIIDNDIPSSLTPADFKIDTLEKISSIKERKYEVWFTGKYLRIPVEMKEKFTAAVNAKI